MVILAIARGFVSSSVLKSARLTGRKADRTDAEFSSSGRKLF
jgi:hypothetical protein